MDKETKASFDNSAFSSSPPPQPTAGTLGRAVQRYALWSGKGMLVIGIVLVGGSMILPPAYNPAHWIATTTGRMEADEINAAIRAKAAATRQLAAAQIEEQQLVQAIQDSMAGEIAMGQMGDMACMFSKFFAPGGASQFQDLRDGLQAGCGMSDAVRDDVTRNLVFRLHDIRTRIAQLEEAGSR